MTNTDFTSWRAFLGISRTRAAELLGCAPNTITAMERDGAKIAKYIDLACAALAADLPPWSAKENPASASQRGF